MTDITEFVRARLDEDEQTALQDPHPEYSRPILSYIDYGEIEIGTARVLAQVAAMRAIVDLHRLTVSKLDTWSFDPDTGEQVPTRYEVDCAVCGWASDVPTSGCATVRQLAAIWRDHDDYGPAWAPEGE